MSNRSNTVLRIYGVIVFISLIFFVIRGCVKEQRNDSLRICRAWLSVATNHVDSIRVLLNVSVRDLSGTPTKCGEYSEFEFIIGGTK